MFRYRLASCHPQPHLFFRRRNAYLEFIDGSRLNITLLSKNPTDSFGYVFRNDHLGALHHPKRIVRVCNIDGLPVDRPKSSTNRCKLSRFQTKAFRNHRRRLDYLHL